MLRFGPSVSHSIFISTQLIFFCCDTGKSCARTYVFKVLVLYYVMLAKCQLGPLAYICLFPGHFTDVEILPFSISLNIYLNPA